MRARGGKRSKGEGGVWRGSEEGGGEWGHSMGEAGGSGANKLSQRNEHLMGAPDWGLRGQVRDPLEEAGSQISGGGTGQDGMLKDLWASGA